MAAAIFLLSKNAIFDRINDYINLFFRSICEFPDEDTPNRLFNGVPFKDIPILYIRVTKNNTHLTLADVKGKMAYY